MFRSLITLLLLMPVTGFAQLGSGQSQVNLSIAQVVSIQVSQPSVNLSMSQPSHFSNGNSTGSQANHIVVTCNTGYSVSVKAVSQNFSIGGNNTTLPVNVIRVQTSVGDDLSGANAAPPADLQIQPQVPLSFNGSTIITSSTGEMARGYNVNYVIPGSQGESLLNRPSGNYNTTITYTIIPQ